MLWTFPCRNATLHIHLTLHVTSTFSVPAAFVSVWACPRPWGGPTLSYLLLFNTMKTLNLSPSYPSTTQAGPPLILAIIIHSFHHFFSPHFSQLLIISFPPSVPPSVGLSGTLSAAKPSSTVRMYGAGTGALLCLGGAVQATTHSHTHTHFVDNKQQNIRHVCLHYTENGDRYDKYSPSYTYIHIRQVKALQSWCVCVCVCNNPLVLFCADSGC